AVRCQQRRGTDRGRQQRARSPAGTVTTRLSVRGVGALILGVLLTGLGIWWGYAGLTGFGVALVSNAFTLVFKPLHETTRAEWTRQVEVHAAQVVLAGAANHETVGHYGVPPGVGGA
ncbi:hypothetical protein ACFQ1S_24070, partial [Kibdelosporangium lantanae]